MLTWQGREIPETLAEIVDPRHTVVIMHDIQNDNTGPGGVFEKDGRRIDVTGLIAPIARFLDEARRRNVRVMYTQYTNLPNFGTFTDPRVRDLYPIVSDPVRREGQLNSIQGTWGCQTIPELKPRPGEIIIDKFRVDAFIGTPLEYLLRLHRIRTIIHTGIATEVGILPTAWHAINLGFFVVVPEDCVGPMQKQYHEEAMAFLRRLTVATRSADIVEAWKKSA
jgi:ureidoacrylate peracid hydrolase